MVSSINLMQVGTFNLEGAQVLGVNLLSTVLQDAFLVFTSAHLTVYDYHARRQSVLFVQGSGLESVIQDFGLEYDADILRENFFDLCYQNLKKKSA